MTSHLIEREWLYPVMTLPLATKTPGDAVCPQSHLETLQAFLADCEKYLVIGTSGRDADLLHILSESPRIPESNPLRLGKRC
jgi:hypothetical protein